MLLSEYDFIQAWLSNLSHGQVMGRDAEILKVQEFGGSNLFSQWSTPSQVKINFCTRDSNNWPKSSVSRT